MTLHIKSFIKQESDHLIHPLLNPLSQLKSLSRLAELWMHTTALDVCNAARNNSSDRRSTMLRDGSANPPTTGSVWEEIYSQKQFTVFICVHKYPALTVAARSNSWQNRDIGINLLVPVKCSVPNREQSNKRDPNKIFVKNYNKPLSASSVPNRYGEGFGHGSVVNSGVTEIRHLAHAIPQQVCPKNRPTYIAYISLQQCLIPIFQSLLGGTWAEFAQLVYLFI